MNICFCTDHYQIDYCLVAIKSIFENLNNETDVVITVFCDNYETQKKISDKCDKNNMKVKAIIVRFDNDILSIIKALKKNTMNFARMYIPLYMDNDFLYLDNDIVVNCDITTIMNVVSDKFPLWAMPQLNVLSNPQSLNANYVTETCTILYGIDRSYDFFNSGVMYVNIDYWKNNDITEKCENILREHFKNQLYTNGCVQPILNIAYFNNYGKLDEVWNYRGKCQNVNDIKIFHWYGGKKPDCDPNASNSEIWLKYKNVLI